MGQIIRNAFYQLLAVYTLAVLLAALGLLWKYAFKLHYLGIFIGILGIFAISKKNKLGKEKLNKTLCCLLLLFALLIVLDLRMLPYLTNNIPLGYDAGIYKYGIEYGLKNLDSWILQGGHEPGFLYLMAFFKSFLSTQAILTWLFIFFSLLLGFAVYLATKEFSNESSALIAAFIYAFSLVQFKVFWFMYYRNIIGLTLMLFAIYSLKKTELNKKWLWLFVLCGGLLGAMHRPTFYIFGLSYFIYAFISPWKAKQYDSRLLFFNVLAGIAVLLFASLFYLGKFREAVFVMIAPVLTGFIQPGEAAGTFINFFTYQFSTLAYIPLSIIGLFYFIKRKEWNILVIWALITFSIVYFQFFFFNRFIIHLDIVLIMLASIGFASLIKDNKKIGIALLVILIISAGILIIKEALNSQPLINSNELKTIQYLNNTEENAFVIATSSIYSPWVLGYSQRRTIAPGIFDYNLHNKQEWVTFWTTSNLSEIKEFLDVYSKPLYIFIGEQQKDNLVQFPECFSIFYQQRNNTLYKYSC